MYHLRRFRTYRTVNFFAIVGIILSLWHFFVRYYHTHTVVVDHRLQHIHIVKGHPYLIDGDSISLQGVEMRLLGIDAPELHQNCDITGTAYPCGYEAKDHLQKLIAGQVVECRWRKKDRYHRALAMCFVNKQSLNRQMVLDGWAVSFYLFPLEEQEARAAKRGIWATPFEIPKQWRKQHPFHKQKDNWQ